MNADADRRYQEYEDRRKRNIELIIQESLTSNARHTTRKACSSLQRLSMPHEERMLKSAYKQ